MFNLDSSDQSRENVLSKTRKVRFHFKMENDVALLREVMGDKGIFNTNKSKIRCLDEIAERLKWSVTGHALGRRLAVLHEKHIYNEKKSLAASGITEELSERDQPLAEYALLLQEEHTKMGQKKNSMDKKELQVERGKYIRDASLTRMSPNSSNENPNAANYSGRNGVNKLLKRYCESQQDKLDSKFELKRRKIDIQEKYYRDSIEIQNKNVNIQSRVIEVQMRTVDMQEKAVAMQEKAIAMQVSNAELQNKMVTVLDRLLDKLN